MLLFDGSGHGEI